MLRVGTRGQSQGATYTGGFQDFLVWALMPRPKLKSRGATWKWIFARGFMVIHIFKRVTHTSRGLMVVANFHVAVMCNTILYKAILNET